MVDAAGALIAAAQKLGPVSETPRLDAELLLADALEMERSALLLQLRDLDAPDSFAALVERRLAHEPVAYILGYQHFWDLKLAVSPAVLIPRADSETLIEAAQEVFANRPPQRIIDLGTGSGALLLAALSCFPHAAGIGIDVSADALAVAHGNAGRLGFANRTAFVEASWRDGGWSDTLGRFDLILCNPPYVENTADLARQVRDHEPHSALFAGDDGLEDYSVLIPQMPALLETGGAAIFELGIGQVQAVTDLAATEALHCKPRRDLAGIERVLVMTA